MPAIQRKLFKPFATNAALDEISQIGSLRAGSPTFSKDPDVVQALANNTDGWFAIAMGENSPAIEDMNAIQFIFAYMISYILEKGIPEWQIGTTYYENSFVSFNGRIYKCVDNDPSGITGVDVTIGTSWVPYDSMVPKEIIDQASYNVLNTDSYLRVIPEDAPPYKTDINLPPLANVALGFKLTIKNCAEPLSTMIVSVIGETDSIDGRTQIDLDIRDSITIIKGSDTSWDII